MDTSFNQACRDFEGTEPPEATRSINDALLAGVLDELDYGVMLLADDGRLLLANEVARALLRRGVLFSLVEGKPMPADVNQRRRWRALLDACASNERKLDLFVSRTETLSVALVPLAVASATGANASMLATFGRQRSCEPISLNAFARAFGLSATETRVLASLAAGRVPAEIAEAHQVAISTVRTQIKQVLSKTSYGTIRDVIAQTSRLAPMRSKDVLTPFGTTH
ncbi:MAG: helix-turn-helix transcriptional regulator [Burkholderiaceae bacterium]|nr:helix-turn-helix transcriptional regulator [Burkholderiaceae bacterium]